MRISVRPLGALVAGGLLVAGSAGCSSEDDGGGKPASGLAGALETVPSSASHESVTYYEVPTARRLAAKDKEVFGSLASSGYGIPEISEYSYRPDEWGFDEKDVKTSLLVGSSPTSVLTGTFDKDAVLSALKKHGFRAAGTDGGDHLTKSGTPSTYEVSGSVRIRRTGKDSARVLLTPPAKSLADDASYKAVTDCLGDPYEATLYGKGIGKNKDVGLLAIGGHLGRNDASSETLCALTASRRAAEATAKTLRTERTAPGKRFAGSKVVIGGGDTPVVSMTWKNSAQSGMRPTDQNRTIDLPRLLLKLF